MRAIRLLLFTFVCFQLCLIYATQQAHTHIAACCLLFNVNEATLFFNEKYRILRLYSSGPHTMMIFRMFLHLDEWKMMNVTINQKNWYIITCNNNRTTYNVNTYEWLLWIRCYFAWKTIKQNEKWVCAICVLHIHSKWRMKWNFFYENIYYYTLDWSSTNGLRIFSSTESFQVSIHRLLNMFKSILLEQQQQYNSDKTKQNKTKNEIIDKNMKYDCIEFLRKFVQNNSV